MVLSAAVVGIPPVKGEETLPFNDIASDTWYYDAVKTAFSEGIMNGKGEGVFDPTATITRAEVVTAFARIACVNIEGKSNSLPFSDTVPGQWYSDSVGWAAENCIVNGRGNDLFSPADKITRVEIAQILLNFLEYTAIDLPDSSKTDSFTDSDTFNGWMIKPIEAVRKNGLMQGSNGKFNPDFWSNYFD
ncbi:MAG: S-layer homology domain-containing protein [Clostridia bacterium]|nr:S-layer homology domain-containing protein [Clostridia bacterium]MBR5447619.1 S-layer homology domain-containing protein [Clostridia bacterium]